MWSDTIQEDRSKLTLCPLHTPSPCSCLIWPASLYSPRCEHKEITASTWRVSPKETWFPKVLHTCQKWTAQARGGEGRSVCLGGTCSIPDHICNSKQCKTRGKRIHSEKWSVPRTWHPHRAFLFPALLQSCSLIAAATSMSWSRLDPALKPPQRNPVDVLHECSVT